MSEDIGLSYPYQELSGYSALFIDYLSVQEKALKFYAGNPFLDGTWKLQYAKPESPVIDRSLLVKLLRKQNEQWGDNKTVFENISRLGQPETRAVVTGQQVGILGGPVYTVYKAITAIQLARDLEKKGIPCVPVFWMETNDHDFDEIRKTGFINSDGEPFRIEYDDPGVTQGGPVGGIQLSEAINQFLELVQGASRETEFSSQIFGLIRDSYMPGRTFGDAFGRFMSGLFSAFGLILFNPNDSEVGKVSRDFYRRVIEKGPEFSEAVETISRELAGEEYPAQVKLPEGSAHLFYMHEGKRLLLKREGVLKAGTREFTGAGIEKEIEESPEKFSPTVLTRPLLQDYLFPTISYIAGPAELAYWAQVKPLYALMGMNMPLVYPRASGTLLESRTVKILDTFNLSAVDVIADPAGISRRVVKSMLSGEDEALFNNFREDITRNHIKLLAYASAVDKTLQGAVDTMRGKIEYQINNLQQKITKAQERKHSITTDKITRAASFIMPQGKPQERELSICHFLLRHGTELIARLVTEIPLDSRRHFVKTL